MRISSIIKSGALLGLVVLVFSSLALADIIYLRDGSVLRGKITEETTESITIEGESYWTTVKRADIQKIVREVEKPKEERPIVIREGPSSETLVDMVFIAPSPLFRIWLADFSVGMSILAGVGVVFLVLMLIAVIA